jgi:hypothetical protein
MVDHKMKYENVLLHFLAARIDMFITSGEFFDEKFGCLTTTLFGGGNKRFRAVGHTIG